MTKKTNGRRRPYWWNAGGIQRWLLVLAVSVISGISADDSPTATSDLYYSVKLEPFQLLFTTSTAYASDDDVTMTETRFLMMTRKHLDVLLGLYGGDANSFVDVELYMTHRADGNSGSGDTKDDAEVDADDPIMFRNGTKFAFMGTAYYLRDAEEEEDSSTTSNNFKGNDTNAMSKATITSQEEMLSNEYRCFLGHNKTRYVALLQAAGWPTLRDTRLMTPAGDFVMLDEERGDIMVMIDNSSESTPGSSSATNTEDMSKAMYLLAVLIPLAIVSVASFLAVLYWTRHNVDCVSSANAPVHPVWQLPNTPESHELRRKALELQIYLDADGYHHHAKERSTKS